MGEKQGRDVTVAGAPTVTTDNDASADAGGMPFDDDFDAGEPSEPADRGDGRLPAYDSGTILQQRGIGYPSARPAGMTALREYVMDRWGGADLGCLSIPPRPMRGGTSPSLHNWGMAWDWRWANPGPGRASANEVIEFCVEHAGDLGIQGVHDYEQCRYWKSYDGWNTATASASEWVRRVLGTVAPHRAHVGRRQRRSLDTGGARAVRWRWQCRWRRQSW